MLPAILFFNIRFRAEETPLDFLFSFFYPSLHVLLIWFDPCRPVYRLFGPPSPTYSGTDRRIHMHTGDLVFKIRRSCRERPDLELGSMTSPTFIDLVRRRTSCRAYDRKPVPKEHLELMLEAARVAPSACNRQPWRFAMVTEEVPREQLVNQAFLKGISMKWALGAGAIIALGMEKSTLTHKIAPKISGVDYPLLDLGIAGEHLVLQAEELGLGTCWIGWIRPKIIRRIIGWPRSIDPVALITVGWPASIERIKRPRMESSDIAKWL